MDVALGDPGGGPQRGDRVDHAAPSQVVGRAMHCLILRQFIQLRSQMDVLGAPVLLPLRPVPVEQHHVHDVRPLVPGDQHGAVLGAVRDQVAVDRVGLEQLHGHTELLGQALGPLVQRPVQQVVLVGHQDAGRALRPERAGAAHGVLQDPHRDGAAELHRAHHGAGGVPVLAGVEALRLVADQQ